MNLGLVCFVIKFDNYERVVESFWVLLVSDFLVFFFCFIYYKMVEVLGCVWYCIDDLSEILIEKFFFVFLVFRLKNIVLIEIMGVYGLLFIVLRLIIKWFM